MFFNWSKYHSKRNPAVSGKKPGRQWPFRPHVESLESRLTPTGLPAIAFTITNQSPSNQPPVLTVGTEQTITINVTNSDGSGDASDITLGYATLEGYGYALPPGLGINTPTGIQATGVHSFTITGTPTRAGEFDVAFVATDVNNSAVSDSIVYKFNILPNPSLNTFQGTVNGTGLPVLPIATIGQPYNQTITFSHNTISSAALLTEFNGGTLISAVDQTSPVPGLVAGKNVTGVSQAGTMATGANVAGLVFTWTQGGTTLNIAGTPTISAGGLNDPLLLQVQDKAGDTLIFGLTIGNSPQNIRNSYRFNKTTGMGANETVVILTNGDYPGLVSSTDPNWANSDLSQFDTTFSGNALNLNTFGTNPASSGPFFLKLDAMGGTDYNGAGPAGDPGEAIQDVEWVHALAPLANIILLEKPNSGPDSGIPGTKIQLNTIYNWVNNGTVPSGIPTIPKPTVVSTSEGPEVMNNLGGSAQGDPPFANGVTYVVSSGDFPPVSTGNSPISGVISAGYTQLVPGTPNHDDAVFGGTMPTTANTFQSGGGVNSSTQSPTYQTNVPDTSTTPNPVSSSNLTFPDVGFNGSEASGDFAYNSYENTTQNNFKAKTKGGNAPNYAFGVAPPFGDAWGTSMASPSWAAIFAIVDGERLLLNKPSLSSAPTTVPNNGPALPMLYALAGPRDFNQISATINQSTQVVTPLTTGQGNSLYNQFTGLGSPKMANLVSDLVGPTITPNSSTIPSNQTVLTISGNFLVNSRAKYTVEFNGGVGGVTGTVTQVGTNYLLVSDLKGLSSQVDQPLTATVTVTVTDANGSPLYSDTSGSTTSTSGTTPVEVATVIAASTSANQLYVDNLYQLLLHRGADPGSNGWVTMLNNGASPSSVVAGIESSTEYLNDIVNALYAHYLNRPADPGGLATWTNVLAGGATIESVTASIVGSPEYSRIQNSNPTNFIQSLYVNILGRNGSASEVQSWVKSLAGGMKNTQVALGFLTSTEYRTNLLKGGPTSLGTYPFSPNWVGYFPEFLSRPVDSTGLAHWLGELQSGQTDQAVLAGILGSAEGYKKWM